MVRSKGGSVGESLDGSGCGSLSWLVGGWPGTHRWVHSCIDLPTPGKVALTNLILSDQCAISGASGS